MLRRTKKDRYQWVPLDPPIVHSVKCKLSDIERRIYKRVAAGGNFLIGNHHVREIPKGFAMYMRLQQACLLPKLIYKNMQPGDEEAFEPEEVEVKVEDIGEEDLQRLAGEE
jgi:SNF2 family DNA or RNA helicase